MGDRNITAVLGITPKMDAAQSALKGLADEMKRSQVEADKLRLKLDPKSLAQQVSIDRARTSLSHKYASAYGTEHTRQTSGSVGVAGETMGKLAESMRPLAVGAGGAFTAFKALGDEMASFVTKADPAAANRWSRSVEDMQAVIGSRLSPVLDLFTSGMRTVGDAMHAVLPSAESMANAVRMIKSTFEAVADSVEDKDDKDMRTKYKSTSRRQLFEDKDDYEERLKHGRDASFRRKLFEDKEDYKARVKEGKGGGTSEGMAVRGPARLSSLSGLGMQNAQAMFGNKGPMDKMAETTMSLKEIADKILERMLQEGTNPERAGAGRGADQDMAMALAKAAQRGLR